MLDGVESGRQFAGQRGAVYFLCLGRLKMCKHCAEYGVASGTRQAGPYSYRRVNTVYACCTLKVKHMQIARTPPWLWAQ